MEPAAGLAGCRPCQQRPPPASLLPILGEAAQSWSNLRDSQSVGGMADPPKAPGAGAPPQPQLSPLSGAYLLIVVGEPFSEEHKKLILQKLQQGRKGSRTGRSQGQEACSLSPPIPGQSLPAGSDTSSRQSSSHRPECPGEFQTGTNPCPLGLAACTLVARAS